MIFFVGDKPSSKNISHRAFHGADCEKRLLCWIVDMGIHANSYLLFNKDDLSVDYRGVTFDDGETYADVADGDKIVAVGKEASKHLFHLGIPHFILPHPSGLNRQINDDAFIEKSLMACKAYLNK